jgi:TonB family protein
MRREKKFARALLCVLVLVSNGVGTFAQDQVWVRQDAEKRGAEKIAQEGQIEKGQIMISPAPVGEPFPQESFIFGQQGDNSITFISEMSFEGKTVKGSPYSADAVTETVMVLGDGNRITRTTTAKLYRDSEGRTRREQSLNGIGAWAASENAPQTVFINDPVAGANYVLNTKTQTAQKAMQFTFVRQPEGATAGSTTNARAERTNLEIKGGVLNGKAVKRATPDYPAIARAAGAQGNVDVEVTVDEQGNVASARAVSGHPLLQQSAVEAARQWVFSPTLLKGQPVKVAGIITFNFALSGKDSEAAPTAPALPAMPSGVTMRARAPEGEKVPKFPETQESLGRQTIEGVQAEGSRTTVRIPAGAIGNERPIQVVSERWYSPELQTLVMTRHSDPRFGETTFRLTNISRTEPDHSLFEVPAGYKITDRGELERHIMLKSPAPPQP